ncbi:cob(I)yrinic acid a,c-diamide adenosyltransferase [Hyphomonas chukchiensis]|uniref:cob(I)yrinic acid a,c-diamide adenosyltransferase n=1 Tax=Hyphomonas chukchiensis TaxID=1280947 RepID=UPI0030FCC46D
MTTDPTHTEKMKALQTEQKKKTSEARDPGRGLILVHTGNGKGKSSSAFGVIIRALGWGHKVGVVQFIKGKWITGERQFFAKFADQVTWHTMGEGFTWDTQDKDRDIAAAEAAFARACEMMQSGDYDLIVLDEINIALRYDYLDVQAVIDGLKARSDRTSVILTGRDARPELMDYADLVSEMTEVKHPFKAGIKAQRGLDF